MATIHSTLTQASSHWNRKRRYTPMSRSCTVILTVPSTAEPSSPVRNRHRK